MFFCRLVFGVVLSHVALEGGFPPGRVFHPVGDGQQHLGRARHTEQTLLSLSRSLVTSTLVWFGWLVGWLVHWLVVKRNMLTKKLLGWLVWVGLVWVGLVWVVVLFGVLFGG